MVSYFCPGCKKCWQKPLYAPVEKYDMDPEPLGQRLIESMYGQHCPDCGAVVSATVEVDP